MNTIKIGGRWFVWTVPGHRVVSRGFALQGEAEAELSRLEERARERAAFEKSARAHRDPPVWGSQQWAETRGDDLGESFD